MSGDSSFLSRWSRLKRKAGEKLGGEAAESRVTTPVHPDVPSTDSPLVAELPPDELAKLTPIENFTVETDLAPFLREGIPSSLRNAALRKMWALDPEIRDRVGDALDYAYDWNVPGGVPGSGALAASDDVQAMLRSIVGGAEAESGRQGEGEKASGAVAEAGLPPPTPASLPPQKATEPSGPDDGPVCDGAAGHPAVAAPAELRPAEGEVMAPARRHGGATPF